MNDKTLIICIPVSLLGIVSVLYLFGLSAKSLVVAAIFLLCPVLVGLQHLRGLRRFDADMTEARRRLQGRNLP